MDGRALMAGVPHQTVTALATACLLTQREWSPTTRTCLLTKYYSKSNLEFAFITFVMYGVMLSYFLYWYHVTLEISLGELVSMEIIINSNGII